MTTKEDLLESIRNNIIGEGHLIETPFGEKPLVYADYTASGRSLKSVEQYIQHHVMPDYANTHTESSFTGKTTTQFREQAKALIRQSTNADDRYAVIFTGSGATSAINKTIEILNLRLPANLNQQYRFDSLIPESKRPVVFISLYEHHSNDLPWRESIAEVITVPFCEKNVINLEAFDALLEKYKHRPLIGSFTAASNVTGIKLPIDKISNKLKQYGALNFWDFASAAPYVDINVSRDDFDAVFISPHKFIGGPGTPGLLIIKKSLLNNTVPSLPGGGTVSWVSATRHIYLSADERREEGGTPAIIESIRAGLVFKLKDDVGTQNIMQLEKDFIKRAITKLSNNPNIDLLGNTDADRLSILSFTIRHKNKFLHYGFIVALLNDLFGIQARGGCSCAGPYGHHLLDIDHESSDQLAKMNRPNEKIYKPGWTRINFNYFINEDTFNYLIGAIDLVASYGWQLLSQYQYIEDNGVWRHKGTNEAKIYDLRAFTLAMQFDEKKTVSQPLASYIEKAREIFKESGNSLTLDNENQSRSSSIATKEAMQWFVTAEDIREETTLTD